MIKYLCRFLKYLEQWERYEPNNFWSSMFSVYFLFLVGFSVLTPESNRQSYVVIEQVRGGGKENLGSGSPAFVPPATTTSRRTNPGGQSQRGQSQSKTRKWLPKQYQPKLNVKLNKGSGGGSGGGNNNGPSSWEEKNIIPPKDRQKPDPAFWDKSKYNKDNSRKKKKREEEVGNVLDQPQKSVSDQPQKTARTVTEKFDSNAVKKLVKIGLKNQSVKNEYGRIKESLAEGVNPVAIGANSVAIRPNIVLIKAAKGRYLVQITPDNQVNVLGLCARNDYQNVQRFKTLMNKMYDVNLKYKN